MDVEGFTMITDHAIPGDFGGAVNARFTEMQRGTFQRTELPGGGKGIAVFFGILAAELPISADVLIPTNLKKVTSGFAFNNVTDSFIPITVKPLTGALSTAVITGFVGQEEDSVYIVIYGD